MNTTNNTHNPLQQAVYDLWVRWQDDPFGRGIRGRLGAYSPLVQKLIIGGGAAISLMLVIGLLYVLFGDIIAIGFIASLLAGLATGLGALPALFFKEVPDRVFNTMLGGAAGVMLAATAFSLVVPGIDYGNQLWPGKGVFVVAVGMVAHGFLI